MKRFVTVCIVTTALVMPASAALSATAAIPAMYKNCTALNAKYPHGLGTLKARDKTTGTPVTTFKRSTVLYNRAMSYNKRRDGIKTPSPASRSSW